jgi:DNA-binding NarL/FixJ family response regulator
VQAVTSARPAAARHSIAVVAVDDLALRRISDTVAGAGIAVVDTGNHVADLSEMAAGADSIVVAGATVASERKALIQAVAERFPGVPVVLIASGSSNCLHKALEAGAAGIVQDSHIETALSATVSAVAAGQVVVPHALRRHATRPALSHRERQTLALVAMGLTNRQIAARLFLAESTVKTHLTSIFGKLGVGSRSEAAALVLDPEQKLGLGLLDTVPGTPIASTLGGQGA